MEFNIFSILFGEHMIKDTYDINFASVRNEKDELLVDSETGYGMMKDIKDKNVRKIVNDAKEIEEFFLENIDDISDIDDE